jgi:hypothetical protein
MAEPRDHCPAIGQKQLLGSGNWKWSRESGRSDSGTTGEATGDQFVCNFSKLTESVLRREKQKYAVRNGIPLTGVKGDEMYVHLLFPGKRSRMSMKKHYSYIYYLATNFTRI